MKQQTATGKALAINKDPWIYGSFAEIGAGQETVNHFFKAGLASQTVAKSMSAYDMTFSDDIYGRQGRYVSKDRLRAMLEHEYRLLERRLKRKMGKKARFFAFAVTAATSAARGFGARPAAKGRASFSGSHHAWMGIRFQAEPAGAFNDIVFHARCRDKGRLQQHEALGILGVNLTYACFHCKNSVREFARLLMDSLPPARLKIQAMECSGPALKAFSPAAVNLELLRQGISPLSLFSSPGKKQIQSELAEDAVFKKPLVLVYGENPFLKAARRRPAIILRALGLPADSVFAMFLPHETLKSEGQLRERARELGGDGFHLLAAPAMGLEDLKRLLLPSLQRPMAFVISEEGFSKALFKPLERGGSPLKSLGLIFDSETKVLILSKKSRFSLKNLPLPSQKPGPKSSLKTGGSIRRASAKKPAAPPEENLRDYLIARKQLLGASLA